MSDPSRPVIPPERHETSRGAIVAELLDGPLSLRELSQRLGLAEREIAEHLPHLERSIRAHGAKLVVEPARCLACGFAFEGRTRFTAPSRCPECKSERIAPATFKVE
jgi:predicted Zn-ribbon and HTH transcriptional regulator